jgi:hypothetical protein
MASGRERSGACFLIQASSVATSAGGTRTPIKMAPTFGLPMGFFLLSDTVDLFISICYQKSKPRGSSNYPSALTPTTKESKSNGQG